MFVTGVTKKKYLPFSVLLKSSPSAIVQLTYTIKLTELIVAELTACALRHFTDVVSVQQAYGAKASYELFFSIRDCSYKRKTKSFSLILNHFLS
jgi:hypothetical protein